MRNTDKSDVRYVARGCIDPFKIPDSFVGIGETMSQAAATIGPCKNAGIPPFGVRPGERAYIENINYEDISWFRTIDSNWPTQHMTDREIQITNIVSTVVVLNLTVSPVFAFHAEGRSRRYCSDGRYIWMPAIVPKHLLLAPGLGEVHLKQGLVTHCHSSHDKSPFSCA